MKVSKNIYFSEDIKNKEQIVNQILNEISVFDVYLICFSKDSRNLFEIFESNQLKKSFNKNKNLVLIGLASSKKEAFLIIEKIFKENKNIFDFKNMVW